MRGLAMTSLATQAAEYASAMASAYAMGGHQWDVDDAIIWSDEAVDLAWHVRRWDVPTSTEAWAETAARLMNGDYR